MIQIADLEHAEYQRLKEQRHQARHVLMLIRNMADAAIAKIDEPPELVLREPPPVRALFMPTNRGYRS